MRSFLLVILTVLATQACSESDAILKDAIDAVDANVVFMRHAVAPGFGDPDNFSLTFDRILVDAPCTGLGALRRRPEARWRRTIKDLKELVLLQRQLLSSAYALLNPGGVIAYVTCSPHLAETKGQVLDFLSTYPDMQLLPMQNPLQNMQR